jgi:hypothetical protein
VTTSELTYEEKRLAFAGLLPIVASDFETMPQSKEEVLAITGADRESALAAQRRIEQIGPALLDLVLNHGAYETPEGYDAYVRMVRRAAEGLEPA